MKKESFSEKTWTRREVFRLLFGIGFSVGIASFVLKDQLRKLMRIVAGRLHLKWGQPPPAGSLSAVEMQSIIALAEVLVPVGMLGNSADLVRDHVNDRTKNVYDLREYRNAVVRLDETSHRIFGGAQRFADLTYAERDKVLSAILWRYRSGQYLKRRLERMFLSRRKLWFRESVVKDLLIAIFQKTPVGWAMVGYSHYPGVPAVDPRDYTKLPAGSLMRTEG